MRTKKLGNTDLELTVVGLGTWAIGGAGWDYAWGEQDDRESIDTIIEALSTGINWIDTAAVYGIGHSEEVVGKAIKEWGKPVLVATKCGLLGDSNGHVKGCLKKSSILKEVDDSLRRLGTDVIDLYQIHWPNPPSDIEEGFETLQYLKDIGKIRYAAVSNFGDKQMERISKIGEIASLQPPYSMINRRIEDTILPYCEKNNIGVVCYSPMQCGLLTGKVTKEWIENLSDSDWRKTKSEYFKEPILSKTYDLVEKLKDYSSSKGFSVAQLAIAWVINNDIVTSAIVGARKKGQIIETAKASEWVFSEEEKADIEEMLSDYRNSLIS